MSNVDINVDRRTDGRTDGQKIGRLYRTLLQAGAIKMQSTSSTILLNLKEKLEMCQYDIVAPAQGHPHPHTGILQKMKLKKWQ